MDKNGLSGFLLGLGVGVGIGMLFAPQSGEETRKIIKDKAGEGTDYVKQRSSEMKQTATEWVEKGKEAMGRQKETISDAVSDAMAAGKQVYREGVSPRGPSGEGVATTPGTGCRRWRCSLTIPLPERCSRRPDRWWTRPSR